MTNEIPSNDPDIIHNNKLLNWKDIKWSIQIPNWGSNFVFYRATAGGSELMIGFGQNRTNSRGFRCNSPDYAQVCQEEQEQLSHMFPLHQFPFLLPSQSITYDNRQYRTVICVRDYVHCSARLDKIQPHHFKEFPHLGQEFSNFFVHMRQSPVKPDIKDPRNLVLSNDGHLRLLDLNTLIYPNDGAYGMVIRTQKAIAQMSTGNTTFDEAYQTIQRGELRDS